MDVEGLLRRMGLTQNYRGLRETAEAVRIALAEPESLCMVTKWLYPASAKRCGTTWKSLERNIRTVVRIAWDKNPELLCEIAGCRLTRRPTAGQFIAQLAAYLDRGVSGDGLAP